MASQDKGKATAKGRGKRSRLNAKTFVIKQGNKIFVTVPVILYKRGDSGYDYMAQKYFPAGMVSDTQAVPLMGEWCMMDPHNSNDSSIGDDDDD